MIKPDLYWTQKTGYRILIADMTDEHLANTVRMLDRNSVYKGKEIKVLLQDLERTTDRLPAYYTRCKNDWVLGEMVGFHPISTYPAYLGLLHESFKRNLDFLDERRLILATAPTFKRSLIIHDMTYFREASDFSEKNLEPENQLWPKIQYLLLGEFFQAEELHLHRDSVGHSFEFELVKNGKVVMNGGIILHGYQETFAVELVGSSKPHYSIHT